MTERVAEKRTLRENSVFQALSDTDLETIARLAVEKEYEAGAVIFRQNDAADEIFLLREGKVALQMQLSGPRQMSKSVTVDMLTTNEVFGWSAIVEPRVYTLSAICLQRAKVLAINGTRFRSLLQENQGIGYEVLNKLIGVVASRLDETRHLLISERLWNPKVE